SVCTRTSPSSTLPVAGSIATCPETNTNPLALMACEYGPMALGASLVAMTSFMRSRFLQICNAQLHVRALPVLLEFALGVGSRVGLAFAAQSFCQAEPGAWIVGIALQVFAKDGVGFGKFPVAQQNTAQRLAHGSKPVGWLVVIHLIFHSDGSAQMRDGAL